MRNYSATEERRERMERARKLLVSLKDVTYIRALAMLSFNLGLSEFKAKEYIRTLKEVGGIRVENGYIYPPKIRKGVK